MLIRRPAAEVWEAFADPDRIRRFWLARSSGRLERGATVRWEFKVAGAATDVRVLDAVPGELLDLRWDGDQPLRLAFADRGGAALVGVHLSGFGGDAPAAAAVESMSGFTLVLASAKVWLEHGIEGDLMYDRFPDAQYADRQREVARPAARVPAAEPFWRSLPVVEVGDDRGRGSDPRVATVHFELPLEAPTGRAGPGLR